MATIQQANAWNTSRPRSDGYYQYDQESGDFRFMKDGELAPEPAPSSVDQISGYLKQFYDPATDTYDIPGVGKVNFAAPWETAQNLQAFGPGSTPETFRAGMFENGGQRINTPYGEALVGVSRQDAPEMSAEPGAGIGGLLPLLVAGGIGAAGAAAGFGFGGLSGAAGGAGTGAGAGSALAGDFASSFLPTLTEAGLTTGATEALIPTLGEIAGTSSLGLPAGGLEAVLGGTGISIPGPLGNLTLDAAGNLLGSTAGATLPNMPTPTTPPDPGTQAPAPVQNMDPTGVPPIPNNVANAAGASSALARALNGTATTQDWLSLAGQLGSVGLGVYGANRQADATSDLYDRFFSLGAPYRQSLAALEANPQGFYSSPMVQGALQQGSDALSRSLSAKVGNPILNPTALQEMQNYTSRGLLDAYNQRFSQLAGAGQLGVSQSAGLGSQAASAQGGVPNALGAGLSSVFGKEQNYAQQLIDLLKNRPSFGGVSLP